MNDDVKMQIFTHRLLCLTRSVYALLRVLFWCLLNIQQKTLQGENKQFLKAVHTYFYFLWHNKHMNNDEKMQGPVSI